MNYIDELYRQMISSQGRLPSSVNDPNAVLNPLGASMPKKQNEIVIESAPVMPIEYPEGYKVQIPQSEVIRQNRNEAILPLMQEAKSMGQNVEALTRQTDADRNALRQAVQKMRDIDFKEYQNPEIDTLIKSQQEKMLTQGVDIPERDMTTELILNLGPALGGMFLGEAGALAAPTAFKQSREIYEGQRKEQIERVKLLKENSEKNLKALIDAKKSGQEAFDKTQERELKKAQYELEGGKALAQQSAQELDRTEQRLLNLNIEIARQRGQGATDIGKMEHEDRKLLEAEKRAKMMAGLAQQRINQPSEGERKAASALSTIRRANQSLEEIGGPNQDQFPSLKDPMFGIKSSILSGRMTMGEFIESQIKDPATRRQLQAEADWVAAKLRRESGAAISVGEFKAEGNRYFPRDGDTPEVIAEKAAARKQVELGLEQEAGRATPPPLAPTPKYKSAEPKKPAIDLKKMTYEQKLKLAKEKGLIK